MNIDSKKGIMMSNAKTKEDAISKALLIPNFLRLLNESSSFSEIIKKVETLPLDDKKVINTLNFIRKFSNGCSYYNAMVLYYKRAY